MTRTVFANGRLVTDSNVLEDAILVVQDGRIVTLSRNSLHSADFDEVIDLEGDFMAPGFIDTQVNGGGGVMFNDNVDVETIARIGAAHAQYGTTGFLPTLISEDPQVIAKAMLAVDDAIKQGVLGVLGIHIEGPFISPQRKGIHNANKLGVLSKDSIQLLSSLKRGRTLVTLAPELCAAGDIGQLVKSGVIVSAGHTNADYSTMCVAFDEGISAVTHLFNAMSPMAHREPGVVGAALSHSSCVCGIIMDRHHVDPVVARIAMRAKPLSQFMLVTDAMSTVGTTETSFLLDGKTITIIDGVCIDSNGTLAGSNLDMASAVRNTVDDLGISLADAIAMASQVPARLLGISFDYGSLSPGKRANLVRLNNNLNVEAVWFDGQRANSGTTSSPSFSSECGGC